MIVIIGILAAIAIPVFLNQRHKAVDAGVKADVQPLAQTEETHYIDALAYTTDADDLDARAGCRPRGNTILVAVNADGYCIKGTSAQGSATVWYDSTAGGLSVGPTAPTGVCGAETPAAIN